MADINHVVLVGRLTRDAELKYTNSGYPIGKFSIAVNTRRKKNEEWIDEANFFDVVLLGKIAESLSQYLVKGKQVGVEGQLKQNRWEQDGQPRSKVEVLSSNIQLLGAKMQTQTQESGFTPEPSPVASEEPKEDDFEDDIPF